MPIPDLELRGIAKRFGSVQALRGADFVLHAGEIHALLGENGAGKTTLMHVAYGMARPDAGEIRCHGAPAAIRSPRDARDQGIGMVHQHFTSVPALTVAENVALALGGRRWKHRMQGARPGLLRRLHESLDPDAVVERLSVGERQRLEIVKALAAGARTLLLDEPTAVLAPPEVRHLLDGLRAFAAEGGAVALITHKLDEVFAAADRVTVLRRGKVTLSAPLAGQTRESLAVAMIGAGAEGAEGAEGAKGSEGAEGAEGAERAGGAVVVDAVGLVVPPMEGRGPGVREATFQVRAGEIVGVAAIEGNGQRELLLAVARRLVPVGGGLHTRGATALVPEDRTTEGLIPALTVAENIALGFGAEAPWVRGPWLDWREARRHAADLLSQHDVRPRDPDAPAATLSGGNQQKLILGRALAQRPAVLIAENPTRGLDIRATVAVQSRIREAARDGVGVLVHSSDLDEVLALADRVLVVAAGRLQEVAPDASRQTIGAVMLGLAVPSSAA